MAPYEWRFHAGSRRPRLVLAACGRLYGRKPKDAKGFHRLLKELSRNEQPAPKWVEPAGASRAPCTKPATLSDLSGDTRVGQ